MPRTHAFPTGFQTTEAFIHALLERDDACDVDTPRPYPPAVLYVLNLENAERGRVLVRYDPSRSDAFFETLELDLRPSPSGLQLSCRVLPTDADFFARAQLNKRRAAERQQAQEARNTEYVDLAEDMFDGGIEVGVIGVVLVLLWRLLRPLRAAAFWLIVGTVRLLVGAFAWLARQFSRPARKAQLLGFAEDLARDSRAAPP